jgi:xanthine dehydrogenase small subunit
MLFQLDCSHVVTVEGLGRPRTLSPVQQALVDHHGSQCGYCTPGMVAALTAHFEARPQAGAAGDAELRRALAGNLCRCTGYLQILAAARTLDPARMLRVRQLFPEEPLLAAFRSRRLEPVRIECSGPEGVRRIFVPRSLETALRAYADCPGALVVAGATDIALRRGRGLSPFDTVLCLTQLAELAGAQRAGGVLECGALTTWSELAQLARRELPELHDLVLRLGSPQIRNQGTIGGSLVSAAPAADILPLLFVSAAELEIEGPEGRREVPIESFYSPAGAPQLRAAELLTRVRIPLPREGELLRTLRSSRRRDLDGACFTAATALAVQGQQIRSARVAFGGVGPAVLRLPRTEAFLAGRSLSEATLRAAGAIACGEISPQTDVRASADHRARLARNALLAMLYEEIAPEQTP